MAAIRCITSSKKPVLNFIRLQCHVKPGSSKQGILSVSASTIEICVLAQAKENEANKAVIKVISSALKCPKSDLYIIQGLKSRDKTVAVAGIDAKGDEQACISRTRGLLQGAIDTGGK